ncbi:MAG: TonB-dependent receptor plug domain-containing protein [Lacunisphaera sp.]|nr:TonB-dependent receptor plug domain-containing protein [Lacunisphaera sp.]
MKPNHTPLGRAQKYLALGLAALLTTSAATAQSGDDALRRLQEENAALRKRLAALESPTAQPAAPAAAASAAQPAAARPSLAAEPTDRDVVVLSPFQVKSDKDYGYLKTNSATATRIGTEIQKVPLNISVISEEFLSDTGMKDIQDVLRYQSSSAGDGRMGILQPATGFTPSGNMSLRGFPINSRLRNGLLRYNAYTLDNVERVEVIKGPAAIFFGNAFPGGVINYVTKQPSFAKIPTSLTWSFSGYSDRIGGLRATLDNNTVLSDKAALRVVGAWDNGIGNARYELQQGYSVNAGLTLVPLKSGRLKIAIEGEILQRLRNQDDDSWRWPSQWFADYKNPPANLIAISGVANAAAYQARILNGLGTWIADVRNAAGDQYIPLWTQPLEHGAYYTDKGGTVIHDAKFNYYGVGSYSKDENSTFSVVTDFAATDWLDIRHSYTSVQSRFDRLISAANPYADQVRFSTIGVTAQGYDIDAYYHQLDLVFKKKFAGIDNKLLAGGFYGQTYNSFYGSVGANAAGTTQFPFFGNLPGAFDKPDEGYVSPIPVALRSTTFGPNVAQEFIRNRTGQILTPMEIFSLYDPGVHISPDIRRIGEISRGLVDHSRPKREEWYLNWQATSMNDRLTTFLGYRQEKISTPGQLVAVNPPWFIVPDNALNVIPRADWVTYGLNEVFSRARVVKGTSKMIGASFEVKKNINVYASYSQTFLPSGVQYLGGDTDPAVVKNRAILLGLNPDTEYARVLADGFLTEIKNEKGKNVEFGVKVSTDDSKIVGTMSVYRVTRENRNVDDTQRQFDEPLNYLLPNKQGSANRVIRWFTASATQETEGAEFEVIWTPRRNYQAVVSGGWMWRAETVSDPSLNVLPNTSAGTIISRNIIFGNRLAYAPEYRLNVFNKYTFSDNFIGEHGRGFSIGLGARYASEIIISNDQNFNAARGGITAGNYVVFQTVLSYPFEVLGYKMTGSLAIDNLTDKDYSEGNFSLADPRSFKFSLGMKF